jgi:TonB family protein
MFGYARAVALIAALTIAGAAPVLADDPAMIGTPYPPGTNITNAGINLVSARAACDPDWDPPPHAVRAAWTGACVDKLLDGPGVLTLGFGANAQTYTGSFTRGVAEGPMTIRLPDGTSFEGEFHRNMPNGHGVLRHPDGNVVEAGFVDDMLDGPGHFTWPYGLSEDFVYQHGIANGPVVMTFAPFYRFTLAFRADRPNGPAITTYADGSRTEFTFKDGTPDPVAVFIDAGGQRFAGAYVQATVDPAQSRLGIAYPPEAQQAQWEGMVQVETLIAADGHVEHPLVTASSGCACFGDAATAAIATWHYRPATIGGHPIPSFRLLTVPFRLQ